eukprot:TRINITY_DN1302_c0_g1_i3.p1 TRINITY_DN1302_c0_g1~~TRINITY_DN1302_c0_g1_i3.p1  ORF type:complete len:353 (+),score=-5.64 TRINITY_DN1302_c0_g1_i3:42-1061(+)
MAWCAILAGAVSEGLAQRTISPQTLSPPTFPPRTDAPLVNCRNWKPVPNVNVGLCNQVCGVDPSLCRQNCHCLDTPSPDTVAPTSVPTSVPLSTTVPNTVAPPTFPPQTDAPLVNCRNWKPVPNVNVGLCNQVCGVDPSLCRQNCHCLDTPSPDTVAPTSALTSVPTSVPLSTAVPNTVAPPTFPPQTDAPWVNCRKWKPVPNVNVDLCGEVCGSGSPLCEQNCHCLDTPSPDTVAPTSVPTSAPLPTDTPRGAALSTHTPPLPPDTPAPPGTGRALSPWVYVGIVGGALVGLGAVALTIVKLHRVSDAAVAADSMPLAADPEFHLQNLEDSTHHDLLI